jgi:acetoin utilization deacetylase AcuC-like enzyme
VCAEQGRQQTKVGNASKTGIVWSDIYLDHDTGPRHPERPDRLRAIQSRLTQTGLWSSARIVEPPAVDMQLVRRVHAVDYVNFFRNACERGDRMIHTPDCAICSKSYEAAQLAAGGAVEAARQVMAGEIRNAFCPVRPPGHHAERRGAMGFCFFNNIAIVAEALRVQHGVERIAIIDWDVHHGNGTQHYFNRDPNTLFISLHQHPHTLFPGTGFENEKGVGPAEGTKINLPMMPSSGDDDYRKAFEQTILPATARFEPEFILGDVGFDAHSRDPLAHIELTTEMYAWITGRVRALADELCQGRLVTLLEGGYDLEAIADCTQAHMEVLQSPA